MKQKRTNIILSASIVFILLSTAGVMFYLHERIEKKIINARGATQILTAKQIAISLEDYFRARGQGLKVLSSFESIKRRIRKQMEENVNSFYRFLKQGYVSSISVFDENGRIIYSTLSEAIGKDYRNSKFWEKLIRSARDSLIPVISFDTSGGVLYKKPLSLIILPVYDGNKFLGAVAYAIEIDSLLNSFIKVVDPELKLYDIWIITQDEVLVFHSAHPEMILRRAQLTDESCLNCHIPQGKNLGPFSYIDSIIAKESGIIRYKLKNYPEQLASFSSLKIAGEKLKFVVSSPLKEVTGIIISDLRLIYVLIVLIIVVLLVFAYLFLVNMREIIRAEEERKQREEKEKLQRLYTLLFQNSNDGVYIFDLEEGKFIEANKKFQEMFGYTVDELRKIDFMRLVAPESKAMIEERKQKIKKGVPVPYRYTFTALAKDGRKIELEATVSYVRFGEKMYVLGIYRDISETLRQKELYESLFENLPVGVVIHQDGKIVKCNKKAVEMGGGKDESDIIGKPVLDFVHPDYREIVKERIERMIERGEFVPPVEEKFIRLDGSIIDVEVRASRIMWEGRPAVQVVVLDVTEVKQLQRELAERYQKEQGLKLRLESILNNISDGIMFQNDQGVIEFVNDEFCKILGYSSPGELIGKTFVQFLDEIKDLFKDKGEIDRIKSYVDNREFVKYSEAKLKNGKIIERVGIPVFEHGKYVGRISLLRDITERKQKEKQVLELQRFEIIGQLASGIAHDFNNVLGIINGMLEIIKMKTTDKNILSYVDSALSAVQRGGEISKRLLQFSKKKVEEFNPISIRNLVLDCVKILEHTTPKNIEIKTSIDEDYIILGSYGDLQQVILNLALNARDAMPKGGRLTITVSSVDRDFVMKKFGNATSDTYVVIVVSDTGVGISDEIKEKIFEPFFTTKEPGKGTGLGLSIVKNIVTIHGGFVDFESLVGKGTSFYVYLPVQIREEKVVKINRGAEKMVEIGRGYKVLVIEDEEGLRTIMKDYLEMLGFTVIGVSDGELGIQKFAENPDIKIVFVDYGLPKIMGDEVIKQISQISKDVKFVLVTGFVDIGDEVKSSLPEGVKFLRKPYTLAQIKDIIGEVFDSGE